MEDGAPDPVDDLNCPSLDGGVGYRITIDPNPDCPECGGLGLSFVTATDSTQLSPQAALLFNGAKQTVHGIEVAIVDRQKPLEMLAKRFGLLKEQVEVDFTDKLAQGLADILGRHDAAAQGV